MTSITHRNANEITDTLNERYSGELLGVRGSGGNTFSYIPWSTTVRLLNTTFGPWGWKAVITDRQCDTVNGIYSVGLRLIVSARDDQGHIIETERPGVGVGIIAGEGRQAHDTALKGALVDGISKAAKMLGDQFGLFLYDKGDPAREQATNTETTARTTTNNTQANRATNSNEPPSENQMVHLKKKLGARAANLNRAQANQFLSAIWPKDGSDPLSVDAAYAKVTGREPVGATNGKLEAIGPTNQGDDFNF